MFAASCSQANIPYARHRRHTHVGALLHSTDRRSYNGQPCSAYMLNVIDARITTVLRGGPKLNRALLLRMLPGDTRKPKHMKEHVNICGPEASVHTDSVIGKQLRHCSNAHGTSSADVPEQPLAIIK